MEKQASTPIVYNRLNRRRPTTSARARKGTQQDLALPAPEPEEAEQEPQPNDQGEAPNDQGEAPNDQGEAPNDQIEAPNDEDESHNNEEEPQTDEDETYPFPGGPEDDSLLHAYKSHIARQLWKGEERPILKVHNHNAKLNEWEIQKAASIEWKNAFERTKLSMVPVISYSGCNKNLISAFVERWHPETNTFHLPFGEMTITLDDVYCLTGLPIEGRTVRTRKKDLGQPERHAMMEKLLGMTPAMIYDARGCRRGTSILLEWLHKTFKDNTNTDNVDDMHSSCRAYLLYMFGCNLFSDKSGTRVCPSWIEYLEDVEKVNRYAWGTATLAYLYRQLGAACRSEVRQLCGYSTLLEGWIYEHFPGLRCATNLDYIVGQPLASRWSPQGHPGPLLPKLQSIRETLDLMRADEVIWCPYNAAVRVHFPLSPVTFYQGCICAHDVVEPYNPDRVLRQFGYVQTVPDAPVYAGDIPRIDKNEKLRLTTLAPLFDKWRNHVLSDDSFTRVVVPPWETVSDYMTWYTRSSHPVIQNPEKRSSSVWRPSTATDDPWEMIGRARGLIGPDAELWNSGECDFDMSLVMPRVVEAYAALNIAVRDEVGPSRNRRRRRN